jgi:hypothetical protein
MFSELEHRLYRCRNRIPAALDEFDRVCERHHREMDTIREALMHEFGGVPVIELYRQAAIRCAKAKYWEAAREWAERGIAVYGQDAIRPEVVEDLQKRVAHAAAKLDAENHPRERKTSSVRAIDTDDPSTAVETLVCAKCGATFQRVRTRGRKPQLCPACRDAGTSRSGTQNGS